MSSAINTSPALPLETPDRHVNEVAIGRGILKHDDDEYEYTLWYLYSRLEAERQMHELAGKFFRVRHIVLFIVAGGFTLASSIISFLQKDSTLAGALAAVAAFVQGIGNAAEYQSRMHMHETAAVELNKLAEMNLISSGLIDQT